MGGPLAAAEEHVSAPEGEEGDFPSFHVQGFFDILYAARSKKGDTGKGEGFVEGQFVAHVVSRLAPRISFSSELSLTANSDAATDSGVQPYRAEVERVILRWEQRDELKLQVGRFHTPISYWNTAFHHGQWLQTTVLRPEMLRFQGGFLPVHLVGAMAEGVFELPGWALGYQAAVGNGRAGIASRAGDAGDVNSQRAWLGAVFARPDRLHPLELGAAIYTDTLSLPGHARTIDETITAAHLAWTAENPELLAEYAHVEHRDDRRLSNDAWYVQVGWRLPLQEERWKPYARYERLDVAEGDPVLATLHTREILLAGVRYEASLLVALKLEGRRITTTTGDGDELLAQVAFTF